MKIEVVEGVEGSSVYIDDFRVAGSKLWGGGKITQSWETSIEDVLLSVALKQSEDERTYDLWRNCGYEVTIKRKRG